MSQTPISNLQPSAQNESPISNLYGITAPRGFRAAGVACGIKKTGALDLALVVSEHDCACAGMFTTNRVQAAPVLYDKATLAKNNRAIRAVVINSGCANAATGKEGIEDLKRLARMISER
ncbi:MAG: bifunctional ornithine acetyltransferase/N-acetylglutamate synthase, partial [Anaerolineae bacterium]|nr:bifunctional ornithine acetyltransferase/N-acetylglutamate synthase [Anaerolineae bacterium]